MILIYEVSELSMELKLSLLDIEGIHFWWVSNVEYFHLNDSSFVRFHWAVLHEKRICMWSFFLLFFWYILRRKIKINFKLNLKLNFNLSLILQIIHSFKIRSIVHSSIFDLFIFSKTKNQRNFGNIADSILTIFKWNVVLLRCMSKSSFWAEFHAQYWQGNSV